MKPRLLDLFCGAGGAAMGYHRAGFDVVGVDITPQPRYPYEFYRADALWFLGRLGEQLERRFDAIHASPPCQAYTTMSNRWRGGGGKADSHDYLIDAVRDLLAQTRLPWVIENVPGARSSMNAPIVLHGGMFGLGAHRPRLFESNVLLLAPQAPRPANPVGIYGKRPDGRLLWRRVDGSEQRAARSLEEGRAVLGIDWMEWSELKEAIPPAYTEFIGSQLLAHLGVVA